MRTVVNLFLLLCSCQINHHLALNHRKREREEGAVHWGRNEVRSIQAVLKKKKKALCYPDLSTNSGGKKKFLETYKKKKKTNNCFSSFLGLLHKRLQMKSRGEEDNKTFSCLFLIFFLWRHWRNAKGHMCVEGRGEERGPHWETALGKGLVLLPK